ncbi:hypothetical protein [Desulfofustis glycolicus]|nr:hypothetical protein [Desulfofustis glycolicus]MCB2216072.1 hypothetical protein [Desulfobulbaceae bacterium]
MIIELRQLGPADGASARYGPENGCLNGDPQVIFLSAGVDATPAGE